jgi:hypothetical protein
VSCDDFDSALQYELNADIALMTILSNGSLSSLSAPVDIDVAVTSLQNAVLERTLRSRE